MRRARLESFRCRSAFKLIQLHERVPGGLIYPGDVVLDCGAAPGSWTQVAASICSKPNSHSPGLVVSFDLLDFAHVPGARCYPHTDVQNWELCARLVNEAIAEHYATSKPEDRPTGASLVLSDMAPNASGIREMDVPAMINLASAVLQVSSSPVGLYSSNCGHSWSLLKLHLSHFVHDSVSCMRFACSFTREIRQYT